MTIAQPPSRPAAEGVAMTKQGRSSRVIDLLLDERLFGLDAEQYDAFVKALDNPPPDERLIALMEETPVWSEPPRSLAPGALRRKIGKGGESVCGCFRYSWRCRWISIIS
jgi:Protein of unknown function (DUF1778)